LGSFFRLEGPLTGTVRSANNGQLPICENKEHSAREFLLEPAVQRIAVDPHATRSLVVETTDATSYELRIRCTWE